ncbi:dsRBD fold-containing protein [Streptomyces sp. NPDC055085]
MASPRIPELSMVKVADSWEVRVVTDDTSTIAEILFADDEGPASLGVGTARRRKGDRRDSDLGWKLALGRAFQDAANGIAAELAVDGHTL